jgi:hypothetical protein
MALINSVKEVRYIREMGEMKDGAILGSPASSVIGAALAGVVSAALVGLYGVGPAFMYLGPLSVVASAVGVIWCFTRDIKDAREVEAHYRDMRRSNA